MVSSADDDACGMRSIRLLVRRSQSPKYRQTRPVRAWLQLILVRGDADRTGALAGAPRCPAAMKVAAGPGGGRNLARGGSRRACARADQLALTAPPRSAISTVHPSARPVHACGQPRFSSYNCSLTRTRARYVAVPHSALSLRARRQRLLQLTMMPLSSPSPHRWEEMTMSIWMAASSTRKYALARAAKERRRPNLRKKHATDFIMKGHPKKRKGKRARK